MTTQQAIDYFGGIRELSQVLGVSTQSIYQWGVYPPLGRQYELEIKTRGELKADRSTAHDKQG
ncbi:Cro/CI family transcriptional regulator [Thermomonas sp.]|uniref:Cro/CI family transcriptional regulator n=1 Tax=Thermomonas sp. TaxID=1971895 RepID=UPI002615CDD7|nr:Cro/CI family transcriptional regulator [Thermomonas sp.]